MHSQACQPRVCTLWLSHNRSSLPRVATHSTTLIICTLEIDDARGMYVHSRMHFRTLVWAREYHQMQEARVPQGRTSAIFPPTASNKSSFRAVRRERDTLHVAYTWIRNATWGNRVALKGPDPYLQRCDFDRTGQRDSITYRVVSCHTYTCYL